MHVHTVLSTVGAGMLLVSLLLHICRNVSMVLARRKDVSRLSQYLTLQLLSGDQVSAHAYTAQGTLSIVYYSYITVYVHIQWEWSRAMLQATSMCMCVCVCVRVHVQVHVCIYGKHHEVLFPSEQANEVQAKGYFRVLG